jgi:hypothetical protein
MGTAVHPAITSPGPWDAFADVDVFVHQVLVERAAMVLDGVRLTRSEPNRRWQEQRCARPSWRSGVGDLVCLFLRHAVAGDRIAIRHAMRRERADGGLPGMALGNLGYRSGRLTKANATLGSAVEAMVHERDGQVVPAGIGSVVALARAIEPLAAVEHTLRAVKETCHRRRPDRLQCRPIPPPEAPHGPGPDCLISAIRYLKEVAMCTGTSVA